MNSIDTAISGARLFQPKVHADSRGAFFEGFRASWFGPEHRWSQWNVSRSKANVIRGLHFHHKQSDYWLVVDGAIQVALVDMRAGSPSYRRAITVSLTSTDPRTLIIPPGVLHGFRAVTDVTLMYLLDQEYDGSDEYAVRWNDPDLGLPAEWYDVPTPVLSPRDINAPLLSDVKVP